MAHRSSSNVNTIVEGDKTVEMLPQWSAWPSLSVLLLSSWRKSPPSILCRCIGWLYMNRSMVAIFNQFCLTFHVHAADESA
jgi:hypothetical protein